MERTWTMPALIPAPAAVPSAAAFAPVRHARLACGLDRHLGPYEAMDELDDFLGAAWCRCGSCGSVITLRTAQRNAA